MIAHEHELHSRRRSRNVGVGLCLIALVAILFVMSAIKVTTVGAVEGFDHVSRPLLDPEVREAVEGAQAVRAAEEGEASE